MMQFWRTAGKFLLAALVTTVSFTFMPQAEALEFEQSTENIVCGQTADDYSPRWDSWTNSQAPPVSWIEVRDHHRIWTDDTGKEVVTGVYPEFVADNRAMKKWVSSVNRQLKKQYQTAEKNMRTDYQERADAGTQINGYWDNTNVFQWGRTDKQVLSFCLRNESYFDGAHPSWYYITKNYDASLGRELSLDDVVVSREELLKTEAKVFRQLYNEAYVYSGNIDTQLAEVHAGDKDRTWQQTYQWILIPGGGLCIYYAPYILGPYASGEFILTIDRATEPQLFRTDRKY